MEKPTRYHFILMFIALLTTLASVLLEYFDQDIIAAACFGFGFGCFVGVMLFYDR